MPRNNNPEGHNQYTKNRSSESSSETRSASPSRDENRSSSSQSHRSAEELRNSDSSVSGRPSQRS